MRDARAALEAAGTQVAFVHQSPEAEARAVFAGYGLDDLPRVSDPSRDLYRAFELRRGGLAELGTPRVWARGTAAVLRGHPPGRVRGDARQLQGVFLVVDGEVKASFRNETAADRPDYEGVAACDADACRLGP